jgi:hypothetical protein
MKASSHCAVIIFTKRDKKAHAVILTDEEQSAVIDLVSLMQEGVIKCHPEILPISYIPKRKRK